jgi:hypothetical protein
MVPTRISQSEFIVAEAVLSLLLGLVAYPMSQELHSANKPRYRAVPDIKPLSLQYSSLACKRAIRLLPAGLQRNRSAGYVDVELQKRRAFCRNR